MRRIRADLRRDTLAAADEVGMDRALADLGDPRELADRYADEHGRRGTRGARRTVRLVGVALAAAALVAAVAAVRTMPRVEPYGINSWADPAFVLTPDPSAVTYVATDIGDGAVWYEVTVRNPGPFAETITGVDTVTSRVGLVPAGPHGAIDETVQATPAARSLTLPAGGVAVLRVALAYPCAGMSPGNGSGVDRAGLEVTMLGVTRSVTVPLGATYLVSTTTGWEPPAGCVPGEPR